MDYLICRFYNIITFESYYGATTQTLNKYKSNFAANKKISSKDLKITVLETVTCTSKKQANIRVEHYKNKRTTTTANNNNLEPKQHNLFYSLPDHLQQFISTFDTQPKDIYNLVVQELKIKQLLYYNYKSKAIGFIYTKVIPVEQKGNIREPIPQILNINTHLNKSLLSQLHPMVKDYRIYSFILRLCQQPTYRTKYYFMEIEPPDYHTNESNITTLTISYI
jgi:hypothetical protein